MALRRRLDGVETVAISQSQQTVMVEFAGARGAFLPAVFREAVGEIGVEVLAFHIDACGRIEAKDRQRWFVAGDNRFLLDDPGGTPAGQPVCLSGRLDDGADPARLTRTAVVVGSGQ